MDSNLKRFLKFLYPYFHFDFPNFRLQKSGIFIILISLSFSFLTFYIYVLKDLPSPRNLTQKSIPATTHIRDRNGTELFKIYSSQNRTPIKLSDLPVYVPKAFVSIEDKNFYTHSGFSPKDLLRAVQNNLFCPRSSTNCTLQGGSTITQQLVKTSLLSPERTFQRKLRELVLSVAIESLYSKDQILEMYLNRVSFGGTAYGIEEASQTYFGKNAKDLTLGEATLLAGLPAAPTIYSPFGSHPELSLIRQNEVLRRMVEDNIISKTEATAAIDQKITLKSPNIDIKSPHFVMYIRDLLAQTYGTDLLELGGLDVTTSLDLNLQQQVEKIVYEETGKIKYLHIKNGATLVTNPQTGEILAMVGSRDYFDKQNDGNFNVTTASRQPGSSIKPLTYALALTQGYTAASPIEDAPITYKNLNQPPYTPQNYDNRYHGIVTLRKALAKSYNIPAVKLLASLGTQKLLEFAKNMGITTWEDSDRFGLSLTLGSGEVNMTDMAVAYGVFANGGYKVPLHPILKVVDSHGRILEEHQAVNNHNEGKNLVLNPQVAFIITDILSDNNARSATFGLNSQLFIPPHKIAVKTGTTNNLRDNWTIGYTSNFLVATWVGNNDNSPMSYVASGVTGASPIWNKVVKLLLKNSPPNVFIPPDGMKKIQVCSNFWEYFVDNKAPKIPCPESLPANSPTPIPTTFSKPPGRIDPPAIQTEYHSPTPKPHGRKFFR